MSGSKFDWMGTYHGVGSTGVLSIPSSANSAISSFASQITAQKIAMATAPERPSVYALTNFLEFRDVPRMLKHAGDLLHKIVTSPIGLAKPKVAASTILAYQFGWKPLFDDLIKVLNFSDAVDKRLRQLEDLSNGKELRRRANFGTSSGSFRGTQFVHSTFGITIQTKYTLVYKVEGWGTIHWRLADLDKLGKKPTWLQAFNSLYGLTPGEIPVQIWKALPWTWAIDWFANVSDALEVSKNLISYKPSRINKMWRATKTCQYQPHSPAVNKNYYGGTQVRTELNRLPLSLAGVSGLHLKVPFLDTFKLSIIPSLLITRLAR